jgi:hypothetical protein
MILEETITPNDSQVLEVNVMNVIQDFFGMTEQSTNHAEKSVHFTSNEQSPHNEERKQSVTSDVPDFAYKGIAFYKGHLNLLYSPPSGMKSLLSIDIGNEFEKCLYILVDKGNKTEISRYNCLGNKAIICTLKSIQQQSDTLQASRKACADFQIKYFYKYREEYNNFRTMEDITDRIYKRNAISNQPNKGQNILDILDAIIAEAIKNHNIRFICLDSLKGLFGNKNIKREELSKITQWAAENQITILCIHHTNSKGLIYGSSAIEEKFDYICRISPHKIVNNLQGNERVFHLLVEKASYSQQFIAFKFKAVFDNGLNPRFESLGQEVFSQDEMYSNKQKNLTETIHEILSRWPEDTIGFEDLKRLINRNPLPEDGSIKNCLKVLADQGIVQKTDNSWGIITIIK